MCSLGLEHHSNSAMWMAAKVIPLLVLLAPPNVSGGCFFAWFASRSAEMRFLEMFPI